MSHLREVERRSFSETNYNADACMLDRSTHRALSALTDQQSIDIYLQVKQMASTVMDEPARFAHVFNTIVSFSSV